ncbi:MAG: ABC transporter substrate-binding protein, partial [Marinobacter sp. T13-3]
MKTRNLCKPLVAGVLAAALSPAAMAEEKDSFSIAWTIYAGWVPWQYAED